VKGTLTELKLVLKDYKPGEIKFVEQDTKMTAYSPPIEMTDHRSSAKANLDDLTGFSATDDAAKRNTDNSLGFPIYSSGILTKQSAKEWIIEFRGITQQKQGS